MFLFLTVKNTLTEWVKILDSTEQFRHRPKDKKTLGD